MNSGNRFLDPLAAAIALAVGLSTFLAVPGVGGALIATFGIAVLAYGLVLGLRALSRAQHRQPRQPVGAGADAVATGRVRRGSALESWLQRGQNTFEGMRQMVAGAEQPVIRGQLENVLFEAGDSIPVLEQLAAQSALVHSTLQQLSPTRLHAQRERLEVELADRSAAPDVLEDRQRALEAVAEQEATVERLQQAQAGLTARIQAIVGGLERLSAQMSETVTAAASVGAAPYGDEEHLGDLAEQLLGLRAGLDESRRYTAHILGSPSG